MFNLEKGSPPSEMEIQAAIRKGKLYVSILHCATVASCLLLLAMNSGNLAPYFAICALLILASFLVGDDVISDQRKYHDVNSEQLKMLYVWCGRSQMLAKYFTDIKRRPVAAEYLKAKDIMDSETSTRLHNQDNTQFKAILDDYKLKPAPNSKHDGDVEIEV